MLNSFSKVHNQKVIETGCLNPKGAPSTNIPFLLLGFTQLSLCPPSVPLAAPRHPLPPK